MVSIAIAMFPSQTVFRLLRFVLQGPDYCGQARANPFKAGLREVDAPKTCRCWTRRKPTSKGMSKMIQKFIVAVCCLIAVTLVSETSFSQTSQGNLPDKLFSQYTTQGGASTATAGLYPAPHPVPQNVGSSYYTYQPLMPHEMLYTHSRNYFNYYNDSSYLGGGGSLNITSVRWQNTHAGLAPLPFSNQRIQALQYRFAKKAYCIDGNCSGGGGFFRRHGR